MSRTPSLGLHLIGVQDALWGQLTNQNLLAMAQAGGNLLRGLKGAGVTVGAPASVAGGNVTVGYTRGARNGVCVNTTDVFADVLIYGSTMVALDATSPFPVINGIVYVEAGVAMAAAADFLLEPYKVVGVIESVLSDTSCIVSVGAHNITADTGALSGSWTRGGNDVGGDMTSMAFATVSLGAAPAVVSGYGVISAALSGGDIRMDWPGVFATRPSLHVGLATADCTRYNVTAASGGHAVLSLYRGAAKVPAASCAGELHIIAIGHGGM